MEPQVLSLLLLTVVLGQSGVKGKEGILGGGGLHGARHQERQPRSPEPKAARCSYTFVVSQPQLTGSLCLTSRGAEAHVANSSEVAALRGELSRQQQQLEELQALLGPESGLAGDVRDLRGESSGLNMRVTQLYSQLVQQVLHSKEQALELRQLENMLLNTTSQVQQVMSSYRELEQKHETLSSMVKSQSELMAELVKQCQQTCAAHPQQGSPVASVTETQKAQNESPYSETGHNVQKDQSVSRHDNAASSSTPNTATEAPPVNVAVTKNPGPWRDCQHVLDSGKSTSGIYLLRPRNTNQLLQAWCEQEQARGGWTVIQRRQDGSVNFFRNWEQYKQGFGNLDGEYWLGLEHLYWLTAQDDYRLRVALEDWQGRQVFAEYDSFRLEPESDSYRLRLGEYHGNAGDSLSWHNNKAFTTLDRDRDAYPGNCAHYQKGGWWYHMCAHSNLNGVWYRGGHYRSRYQDGVYWAEFHVGSYSLKKVIMMIKPI